MFFFHIYLHHTKICIHIFSIVCKFYGNSVDDSSVSYWLIFCVEEASLCSLNSNKPLNSSILFTHYQVF